MPAAESLLRIWRFAKPYATVLMLVAIGLAIARYTSHNWDLMSEYSWRLDWIWVPSAIVSMAVFFLGHAAGWRRAISWHGVTPPWLGSLWAWSRSSLARYLPTPIWAIASRVYFTTQLGLTSRAAAISMATELMGSISGALAIALLSVSVWVEFPPLLYIPIVAGVVVVVLPVAYTIVLRLLQLLMETPSIDLKDLIGWSVQYAGVFVIFGLANVFVLQTLVLNVPPIHVVIGVSALAWALGTLNIFTPSGLGTREFILAIGLENYLEPPELLALGVGSRLVALSGELLMFGTIFLAHTRSQARSSRITSGGVDLPKNDVPLDIAQIPPR